MMKGVHKTVCTMSIWSYNQSIPPLSLPPSPSLLPLLPSPSLSFSPSFQCMLHMSHPDKEIVLQILGLLRLITLNANLKAQDFLYEEISNRDSVFCARVYMLLEDVISTFKETWAKLDTCTVLMHEFIMFMYSVCVF